MCWYEEVLKPLDNFCDMAVKSVFEFTSVEVIFPNNFVINNCISLEFYRIPVSSFQLFVDKLDSSLVIQTSFLNKKIFTFVGILISVNLKICF